MRAIVQRGFGGPEMLELEELDAPVPLPTEVLVRVEAAGVNPVDLKTREGKGMAQVLGEPPFIPGWDVAGVVEEVGYGVTSLAAGDRVFGMPWFPRAASAYAELVTAPSRHFFKRPTRLSPEAAGALPLAGLTAWQILVDAARLSEGQRVLIHAAGGGVGHLAVQIAKAHGARVIGTASEGKHNFLRRIGAEQVIDYRSERFEDAIDEPVDLVVDLVGGTEQGERSLSVLREDGLLVGVPSGVDEELIDRAAEQGKRATGFLVEPDRAGLEGLAALVADGGLHVEIERSFPLADAAEAHAHADRGGAVGKLVLVP